MAFDLSHTLKRALDRTEGDADRAADLFIRWCEQNSEIADLLKPIVKEVIESRLSTLRQPVAPSE